MQLAVEIAATLTRLGSLSILFCLLTLSSSRFQAFVRLSIRYLNFVFSSIYRLRKSSSPSRWLMGLPPTSPRLKFVHTRPGGSSIPRRPPRHPVPPSARSKSLELIDQDEKDAILPTAAPEPLPRPRSRSLDGLLDEDGLVGSVLKAEEPSRNEGRPRSRSLDGLLDTALTDNKSEDGSVKNESPTPVPRVRIKPPIMDFELDESSSNEETRISSSAEDEECSEKSDSTLRPDQQLTPVNSTSDGSSVASGNEKSNLLKAKSCGAGLDSDESFSSNDYKPANKVQGSLLSLPTGAEPKRKRNFMDKCVNKVRSFIRK